MKIGVILECNEQKRTDFGFEYFIDVSLDSDKGVFRRYHASNNPILLIDPLGLQEVLFNTRPGPNGQPIPIIVNTNTRQYTLEPTNYVDPLTSLSRDFVNNVLVPSMPFTAGLITTLLTDNPKLGGLAYEVTDTATGLLFDQPAGIPYVLPYFPVEPLINPPCAY